MVNIARTLSSFLVVNAIPVLEKRDGDGTIASELSNVYMPEHLVQALYEYSPLNAILSAVWSPKDGQASAPALYNLLNAENLPVPEFEASIQNTDPNAPTINQLIETATAVEGTNFYTVPDVADDSVKPYNVPVPGIEAQLSAYDTGTGMNARVFITNQNKLIVAFSGWNPTNIPTDLGAFVQDEGSITEKVNEGQKNAVAFTRLVYFIAKNDNKQVSDIYVAGHSTGAGEAQYVGQQLGFGGVASEGTGIPNDTNAVGKGDNFISFVNFGDVWGSYASDVPNNPLDVIGGPKEGSLPHYGKLIMVGDEVHAQWQKDALSAFAWTKKIPLGSSFTFLIDFILSLGLHFHDANEDGAINGFLGHTVGQSL